MQRRFFLRKSTTGAAATAVSPLIGLAATLRAESEGEKSAPLIDTNISLDRWPFSNVGSASAEALASKLHENGVVQAWAGSFDALLHPNLDAVNDRLAAEAKSHSIFLPMGAVNPNSRSWKRTLDRCASVHRMRGIRLHPDFHGYSLDDPKFAELLDAAAERGLLVQIALGLNSKSRPLSPRFKLEKPNPAALLSVIKPEHRIQILGATESIKSVKLISKLAAVGVNFESSSAAENWIASVSPERIHFGSNAPFQPFSKPDETVLTASIASHNAENLMLQA